MEKLNIQLLIGNKPNFDVYAFKFFILSINSIQSTYEFFFPDIETYPFEDDTACDFENSQNHMAKYVKSNKLKADYTITIISTSFNNDYFFNADDVNKPAIITTNAWDKYFSPPSLFEYLAHTIICCLIYSQKLPGGQILTDEMSKINIGAHDDTRGCIADFTGNKYDERVDIALGYICTEHQNEIRLYYGDQYLKDILYILSRKWIGNIDEKGSIAYNLKNIFKFDINKDSGFNKNLWDKCKDEFYKIPGNAVSEVIKVFLTAIITYFLIKYGIKTDK